MNALVASLLDDQPVVCAACVDIGVLLRVSRLLLEVRRVSSFPYHHRQTAPCSVVRHLFCVLTLWCIKVYVTTLTRRRLLLLLSQAITRQYTPFDNTIVYNGLTGVIGRYEL